MQSVPIAFEDLTDRTAKALRSQGWGFWNEVAGFHEGQLLAIPNFGRKGLNEVKEVAAACGFTIYKMPADRYEELLAARDKAKAEHERAEQALRDFVLNQHSPARVPSPPSAQPAIPVQTQR